MEVRQGRSKRKTFMKSNIDRSSHRETPAQVFSSETCEIFKNTYFEEHLRTIASA